MSNQIKRFAPSRMDLQGSSVLDFNYRDQTLTVTEDSKVYVMGNMRKGDRIQINQPLDADKEKLIKLKEALSTVFKYYHDCYKDTKWDPCCSGHECGCQGMPTDPEYYIYHDLQAAEGLLK